MTQHLSRVIDDLKVPMAFSAESFLNPVCSCCAESIDLAVVSLNRYRTYCKTNDLQNFYLKCRVYHTNVFLMKLDNMISVVGVLVQGIRLPGVIITF